MDVCEEVTLGAEEERKSSQMWEVLAHLHANCMLGSCRDNHARW